MMVDPHHMKRIARPGTGRKRVVFGDLMHRGENGDLKAPWRAAAQLVALLLLASCSTPAVLENSATAVTVRYDGIKHKIDDATEIAQKACAAHQKTAQLRRIDDQGLGQHFAHFNCV